MFEKFHPYLISLIIGLIIGIERERHGKSDYLQPAGVRTFILMSLLGTLASEANIEFLTLGICLFAVSIVLIGYLRSTGKRVKLPDYGLTTEVSLVVVFSLGAYSSSEPFLALLLGIVVLAILHSRKWLHRFSKEILKPQEIQAAIILLIILVATPFFPNRTVDPYEVINPQKLILIFNVLVIIQFSSYVFNRVLGHRLGLMLTGFLGGFVSSTSVFASLPGIVKKHPEATILTISAATFAVNATLIEALFVIFIAAPNLLFVFSLWLVPMIIVGFIIGIVLSRKKSAFDYKLPISTPLELKSIAKLFVFILGILFVVAIAQRWVGSDATKLISFLGGLVELQSVIFATVSLYSQSQISFKEVFYAVGLAVVGSFVSKFFLIWFLNRNKFAYLTTMVLFVIMLAGSIAGFLVNRFF